MRGIMDGNGYWGPNHWPTELPAGLPKMPAAASDGSLADRSPAVAGIQ